MRAKYTLRQICTKEICVLQEFNIVKKSHQGFPNGKAFFLYIGYQMYTCTYSFKCLITYFTSVSTKSCFNNIHNETDKKLKKLSNKTLPVCVFLITGTLLCNSQRGIS